MDKFAGVLKILSIEDLPDGKCKITFDFDDEFKKSFKEHFGYKRFTVKRFNQFVNDALEGSIKHYWLGMKDDSNSKESP
jgi:hypothetical protein